MISTAPQFAINDVLKDLNIESTNFGVSTGSDCFGSGEEIISKSPVDGEIIAKVDWDPGPMNYGRDARNTSNNYEEH